MLGSWRIKTPSESRLGALRRALFHYHLFKNAGTSLDNSFKGCFGEQHWQSKEFNGNDKVRRAAVKDWVASCKDTMVFSSHSAVLPSPMLDGLELFPIIFLRHPIDRLASAYRFERKQQIDTKGALLARQSTFKQYVVARLESEQRWLCRNDQSFQLAKYFAGQKGLELPKALAALDKLFFVGVVDEYELSVKTLATKLKNIDFHMTFANQADNVTQAEKSLNRRLISIERELGTVLTNRLYDLNQHDLIVYEKAKRNLLSSSQA